MVRRGSMVRVRQMALRDVHFRALEGLKGAPGSDAVWGSLLRHVVVSWRSTRYNARVRLVLQAVMDVL
jgi:hypothetical protein